MKKYKKFLSVLCAVSMVLAMAVPTYAVTLDPEDDPYYSGVDWSQVDTSMCVPGTEYHFFPQNQPMLLTTSYRNILSGWMKGVPANSYPGISQYLLYSGLAFEDGETGEIQVQFTDSQDPNKSDINISVYDKDIQAITDYFSLTYNSTTPSSKSFYVDPNHTYNLYISHQGSGLQNVRVVVNVG